MNRKLWWVLGLLAVVAALRLAGGFAYWRHYATASLGGGTQAVAKRVAPRMRLPGAAEALPRATAESALIAPEALQQATDAARQQGVQALLVHRNGHRVHEYFANGRDDTTEVEGGELAASLMALSLGALVDTRRLAPDAGVAAIRGAARPGEPWRNPWSAGAQRRFTLAPPPAVMLQDLDGSVANTIAGRVWQPLRAADAWLWGADESRLRLDCCVVARIADWMRVADLLLQQGSYQGERIVSPDWIRTLLAADAEGVRHPVWLGTQRPWSGEEPPATREIYWFDLGADARLWLAPRRGLAVLHWAGAGNSRDTLIPNIILRGLLDQSPGMSGSDLNQLVPGH